jgi:deoxyribose-phosphate aldolase
MIDVSSVKAEDSEEDARRMVETARAFGCVAVIALPAMTPLAVWLLEGDPRVAVGGVASFPSGGETTATKVFQAREMIAAGCTEVILECHHLDEEEMLAGCDCAVKAGRAWVKTNTGWPPTGATSQNISLIRSRAGNAIGIKAAGGIRDLATLVNLYSRGARRFGLGW